MSNCRDRKISYDGNLRVHQKKNEILICGHSSWTDDHGFMIIPDNTYLYMYAPLGSALSMTVPRAIAAGVKIEKGDLTIQRISPITLFNYGYEDLGEHVGDFTPRHEEMKDYPKLLGPGEVVPNYHVSPPGEDRLNTNESANILIENITEKISLKSILENQKGNICHFGGCSWVRQNYAKRNIVIFKDENMEDRFTVKLSDEEKREKRVERFTKY